jgi:uncharacterized caspase-like protein/uncharacterized coiled-coil DUF342 family protein
VESFMVVDCLLPGQIRQLGGKVTYVTARRAVKTAARDCEIRGGEYTAFDRANYATALKVWLPLAEAGDPAAQTYVGEIYEQGLGTNPDPATAATWYRKAADKGYSRAALNLGTLYEQGRGVERDPTQALNWFRKASGLPPAATFELTGVTTAAPSAELTQLKAEVGQLRRELEAKSQELTRLQGELDTARKSLDGRRAEADADRATVAQLQRELDASRQRVNAGRGRISELEKTLTEREARLARSNRELSAARAAQAAAEQQKSADASRLAAQTAQLQSKADTDRGQVAALRAQLTDSRNDANTQTARVTELALAVAEREESLATKTKEMDALRATVAKLEGEAKDQRERLDRLRQQTGTTGTGPLVQIMQPELRTMRDGKNLRAVVASDRTVVVGRVTSETELLTFTVNDRAEKLLTNNVFRTDLALTQPEHPMRIVAIDKQGRRSTVEFVVVRSAAPATAAAPAGAPRVGLPRTIGKDSYGTYHALVIGNNEYRQLRKLKTAVADAREVARVLEKDYGFRVKLLLNASRYDMLAALNDLREKLTDKDNLLIYYAGHGELDERNQRGNWLPVDAEPNSTANWISNVAITDVLNATNVQQLLVVADSCYSGTLTRSSVGRLEGGLSDAERLKLVSAMANRRSRMVLTSGGVEPVIDSAGGAHSAFAQAFLEVLRANAGVMPGQELFTNLQLKVAAIADRVQMRQVPEYAPIKYAGHESGDFVFVRQN